MSDTSLLSETDYQKGVLINKKVTEPGAFAWTKCIRLCLDLNLWLESFSPN